MKNNGGFVYPFRNTEPLEGMNVEIDMYPGITRRDWLAGLAMQGILASGMVGEIWELVLKAYQIADAMIAESEKV